MEGERITANLPPGECGSHNPLRVRELTPKPVTLMLAAKAMQGPTMARPKQLASNHPWVLPSDQKSMQTRRSGGCKRGAFRDIDKSLIPQSEKDAKASKEPSQMLVAPEESPRT